MGSVSFTAVCIRLFITVICFSSTFFSVCQVWQFGALFGLECYLLNFSLATYCLFNFQTASEGSQKNSGWHTQNICHLMPFWATKSLESNRTFILKFFLQLIQVSNLLFSIYHDMSMRKNILKHFDFKISIYLIFVCLIDMSSISAHLEVELDFSVGVHCLVMLVFWNSMLLFSHGKQVDHALFSWMIRPSHRYYLATVGLKKHHLKAK